MVRKKPADPPTSYLDYQFDKHCPPDRRMALQLLSLVEQFRISNSQPETAIIDEAAAVAAFKANNLCVGCSEKARPGKLYCDGYPCQEIGGTVRYVRKALSDGSRRLELPAVQEALGIRHLMALQGGYDRESRKLSPAQRKAILERDNYRCKLCGGVANQVDHILGSSKRQSNLRALCANCNRGLPFEAIKTTAVVDIPEEAKKMQEAVWIETAARIASLSPITFLDLPNWKSLAGKIGYARRKIAAEKAAERKVTRDQQKAKKAGLVWEPLHPTAKAQKAGTPRKGRAIQHKMEDDDDGCWEDIDDYVYLQMQKDN